MHTNKRVTFVLLMAVGTGMLLTGCSSERASDSNRYHNRDMGFSMRFHDGWEVVEGDGIDLALVEAVSPWEDDHDEFAEHMSVDVEELPWQPDLETYFAETIDEQGEYLPRFRAEEKGSIEIDGVDARWVVFAFESEGCPMRAVGYTFLKDKKAFLIAGVAQAHKFVLYKAVFDQMAASFRFD
jgi:hypothetical protein